MKSNTLQTANFKNIATNKGRAYEKPSLIQSKPFLPCTAYSSNKIINTSTIYTNTRDSYPATTIELSIPEKTITLRQYFLLTS